MHCIEVALARDEPCHCLLGMPYRPAYSLNKILASPSELREDPMIRRSVSDAEAPGMQGSD
jgi:hypothetical protein